MCAEVKIGAHLSFVVIDPGPGTKYEVGAGEQQTRPISHYSTLQISHQSPVFLHHMCRGGVARRALLTKYLRKNLLIMAMKVASAWYGVWREDAVISNDS